MHLAHGTLSETDSLHSTDNRLSICGACSVFDHWEQMTYDPLKEDSPANVIMLDVRKRKGLKPQPNVISEYEVRC